MACEFFSSMDTWPYMRVLTLMLPGILKLPRLSTLTGFRVGEFLGGSSNAKSISPFENCRGSEGDGGATLPGASPRKEEPFWATGVEGASIVWGGEGGSLEQIICICQTSG